MTFKNKDLNNPSTEQGESIPQDALDIVSQILSFLRECEQDAQGLAETGSENYTGVSK
jgi:hypothetical protein